MLKTYEQFILDGKNLLHNAEYLLEQMNELTRHYDITEITTESKYTLSIYDKSASIEPIYQVEVENKHRIEIGYFILDIIYKERSNKPDLKVVN